MSLKNVISEVMNFSKVFECDINTAFTRIGYEIKNGERNSITVEELDDAKAFIKDHYNTVVNAYQSGDYTILNELLVL